MSELRQTRVYKGLFTPPPFFRGCGGGGGYCSCLTVLAGLDSCTVLSSEPLVHIASVVVRLKNDSTVPVQPLRDIDEDVDFSHFLMFASRFHHFVRVQK